MKPCDTPFPRYPREHLAKLVSLESKDLYTVIAFAMGAGLMALATPVAVQALVNTIAFGVLLQPLLVLMLILLACLTISNLLNGMQIFVVEMIQRRLFVRLVSQISHKLIESRLDRFFVNKGAYASNFFFEVMSVQKTWSTLMLDGLAYGLQTIIGLVVLAFYHPALLAFDALIVFFIYLIFKVLGKKGVETAVMESGAKYAVAAWLQELPRNPFTIKAGCGARWAQDKSNLLTEHYLQRSEDHFRIVIKQQAAILALHATANSVLLGLGGLMVIERQLTLGQLVASELIVSTMLLGLTRLGKTVTSYYDLMAAMDKLSYLMDLPSETKPGANLVSVENGIDISFRDFVVEMDLANSQKHLSLPDIELSQGEKVLIVSQDYRVSRKLAESMSGMCKPAFGSIFINHIQTNFTLFDNLKHQAVTVIQAEWFEDSILENIRLGREWIAIEHVHEVMRQTGLDQVIRNLPDGVMTPLTTSGMPLDGNGLCLLTLARAIAGKPRVLIIGHLLDHVEEQCLPAIIELLLNEKHLTLVMISSSPRIVAAFADRIKVVRLAS